jgi:hypothetical protein
MKNKVIKFYTDAWFKVEYTVNKVSVNFKAWEIDGLNEDNPELSEIQDKKPVITGYIKWDGCCKFNYKTHYCGIYKAK